MCSDHTADSEPIAGLLEPHRKEATRGQKTTMSHSFAWRTDENLGGRKNSVSELAEQPISHEMGCKRALAGQAFFVTG